MDLQHIQEPGDGSEGLMLYLSKNDAYDIIVSLAEQLRNDSPNVGRKEFYLDDGRYFSIAIWGKNEDKSS